MFLNRRIKRIHEAKEKLLFLYGEEFYQDDYIYVGSAEIKVSNISVFVSFVSGNELVYCMYHNGAWVDYLFQLVKLYSYYSIELPTLTNPRYTMHEMQTMRYKPKQLKRKKKNNIDITPITEIE